MTRDAITPGDLAVEVSQNLRRVLTACDAAQHVVNGSFASIDLALEPRAHEVRVAIDALGTRLADFLERLERTPAYLEACARRIPSGG